MQISCLNYNRIKSCQKSKAKSVKVFIPSTLAGQVEGNFSVLISLFLRLESITIKQIHAHSRGSNSTNSLVFGKISFFFYFFKNVQNISKSQPEILVRAKFLKYVKNWFAVRFRRF